MHTQASTTRADPVLTLEALSVGFEAAAVLGPLDMSIFAGELVAVHGQSGCGKTTLLRTLAGLIEPCGGVVRLMGQTPAEVGWPSYRRQVVWVSQQPVLTGGSVEDNLRRVFAYRSARGKPLDLSRAVHWLTRLGLSADVLGEPARQLSVGQQQRVALVRAVMLRPRVLLLDEPTSALDPGSAELVEALLRELACETGVAGLVVTHHVDRAGRWADRQIELPVARGGDLP